MIPKEKDLLEAFELHSVEGIRNVLEKGLDPRSPIDGKLPIHWLIEMYTRSDRFPGCLRMLLDHGAVLDDPLVLAALLDDADTLTAAIRADPPKINHRTTLVSAFTPLAGASLLHVAAEYGNVNAAQALVKLGANVDAPAAVDEYGLNGHTPLFHTVNANGNRSAAILRLLLDAGARTDIRLAGITWGKGFPWETTVFDVTPLSYAQFGLLPQMHRMERDVYENIQHMLEASGRVVPPLENVPNKYLKPKTDG